MKNKTYLVIGQLETDGEIVVKRMSGDEIRMSGCGNDAELLIIDGNILKGLNSKIDLTKL